VGQGYYEIIGKGNKMKLVSFSRLGKARFGAVVKDGVIDLTGKLDPDVNTIKELISLHMEDQADEFIAGKNKDLSFSDIIFLPVIPDPEKNYVCWLKLC
jgi:hypothetical protein